MKNLSKILTLLLLLFFLSSPAYSAQLKQSKSLKRYDTSLMILPTTIMQKIKQKKSIFLVDIRHKTQFNKFKIPGSINIPLSFIKTKQFLKTKPIALINKGFGYYEIENEVKDLNQIGFNIKILQGGLAAWKHKGGSIAGDPFAQKDLNIMPVKDFFMEKEYEKWIIINACSKPLENQKKVIPKMFVSNGKKDETIGELIQSIFSGKALIKSSIPIPKHNTMMSVIIFNETGKDYDKFEKKIPKTFKYKVFYLEGGIKAYYSFLNSQKLANKSKSQRTREVGHCEPCKKSDKN